MNHTWSNSTFLEGGFYFPDPRRRQEEDLKDVLKAFTLPLRGFICLLRSHSEVGGQDQPQTNRRPFHLARRCNTEESNPQLPADEARQAASALHYGLAVFDKQMHVHNETEFTEALSFKAVC